MRSSSAKRWPPFRDQVVIATKFGHAFGKEFSQLGHCCPVRK